MHNSQIANRIKFKCNEKNISVARLLNDCKISKSLIYDLEKRNTSPSCDKILRIADYLDVSVDYLLCRTDNSEINK